MRWSGSFTRLYRTFQAAFRARKRSVPPAGIRSLFLPRSSAPDGWSSVRAQSHPGIRVVPPQYFRSMPGDAPDCLPQAPDPTTHAVRRANCSTTGSDLPNILISRQLMRYSALFISLDRTFQACFRASKRSVSPAGMNCLLRVRS